MGLILDSSILVAAELVATESPFLAMGISEEFTDSRLIQTANLLCPFRFGAKSLEYRRFVFSPSVKFAPSADTIFKGSSAEIGMQGSLEQ